VTGSWFQRLKTYFDETAGTAPPTVWLWDTRPSLLARIIVRLFYLARCLSPLQHLKQYYRIRKRRAAAESNAERYKNRLDFEARDSEIYFLVALAVIVSLGAILYLVMPEGSAAIARRGIVFDPTPLRLGVRIVACLVAVILAIESFVWISYYLLWRSFAEPVYTLYHPAEYFVLFPVVLMVQTTALAILLWIPPTGIFLALVDVAEEPAALVALGKYYFVVIIANLLSMFPQTRFKTPVVINIVGAGDVVENRMLPALLEGPGKTSASHIQVFTLGPGDAPSSHIASRGVALHLVGDETAPRKAEERIIAKVIASGAPAIIATPSFAHFRYVTALNSKGIRFAVEKPLSTLAQDIKVFRDAGDRFKERMFALSYYGLEKALPLTYLLSANHHYERFLDIDGAGACADHCASVHFDAPLLVSRLGRLKALRIDLVEGPETDRRVWTEQQGGEGIAFETMIHPLILLQKFVRHQGLSLGSFQPVVSAGFSVDAHRENSTTFLRYDGKITAPGQSIEVTLTCGKYADAPWRRRAGTAEFERGRLAFSFDDKSCDLILDNGRTTRLWVQERFATRNYAVQMALTRQFFEEGWIDVRFDDFDDQIEVLDWLLNVDMTPSRRFTYGKSDYSQLATHLE